MNFYLKLLLSLIVFVVIFAVGSTATQGAPERSRKEVVKDEYIVVLKDDRNADEDAAEMTRTHNLGLKKVYRSALKGYTANIPADKLEKIKSDPSVLMVSENQVVSIASGDGLKGEYFDNNDLTDLKLTRVDPTINFNWGSGSPSSLIGRNTFSVRWTGQVLAPNTETYTFYTVTDDGVRLWVNNQLIIDRWTSQNSIERSGTISLSANQMYNIRMEYFEYTGIAVARLRWSTPTIAKQTIPQTYLYSGEAPLPSPSPTPAPSPSSSPTPSPTPGPLQPIPTGVARIGVNNTNGGSGITVAVIDTGVDLTHPDLAGKIVASTSCVPTEGSANDGNGHGTHVAGTIAALDNNFGVVGVAKDAKIAAVKVLNSVGSGTWADVICGIDWVSANAATYNIKVANMSLGGGGVSDGNCGLNNGDALHYAICKSTSAGVTYVVAAGNDGINASSFVPAAYDDTLITVSALADSDGKPGGLGASTGYGADDTFASFSNYGSIVDLGAPGVNIYSTWKNGGYGTISGTSMASPHVAGAAALYFKSNPGSSWTQVRNALRSAGEALGSGHTDPSGLHTEPVVKAGSL